jgi:uncharacterized NAD(P)/FAD-binding protein YdhS
LLHYLLAEIKTRKLATQLAIILRVYEKSPPGEPIGAGYAFSTHQYHSHITNSTLDFLSALGDDDEEHFQRWFI